MGRIGRTTRRVYVAALAAAVVVVSFHGAAAAPAAAARAGHTSITSCNEQSFDDAVAAGGTVTFRTGCDPLAISRQLVIDKGASVVVDANGFNVVLDAQAHSRFFEVKGSLTLDGIVLQNGRVTGAGGDPGVRGTDGKAGADGSPNDSNVPPGCADGVRAAPGGNGSAGKAGSAGTDGTDGSPGGAAAGGALRVDAGGTVDLAHDTFASNQAVGGDGGTGGAGAVGGPGGVGGDGGRPWHGEAGTRT